LYRYDRSIAAPRHRSHEHHLDLFATETAAARRKFLMPQITKADIVISVGRGLIMAGAIIGATYYIGSWYFAGSDLDAIYQSMDDGVTPVIAHAAAPGATADSMQ
jgi:hypothetical protein